MPEDGLSRMLHALEHDEAVVAPSMLRVREIPAYAPVTDDELVASVHRNLRLASRTLRAEEVPEAGAIWEAEKATLERLRAGVPIEDIMAGFRVSIASIQERLVELAAEHGVPGETVVRLTRLLWQLSDAFSARAAAAYRQQGIHVAVAEQRRRDAWLLGLLGGDLDEARLDHGLRSYGLAGDREYVPFCSAPRPETAVEDLHHFLDRHFGEVTTMMLPSAGRLIGILPAVPAPCAGHLVATGPAATPSHLAQAYAVARGVLDAATMQYDDGVHTVASLGWRLGVPLAPAVTALVRERYLEPLLDSGPFGSQVLEDLRTWLAHDRSIPAAAQALHLHVNTLRYRLARFEELTGCSLADSDTLVELAWALHSERSRPGSPGATPDATS